MSELPAHCAPCRQDAKPFERGEAAERMQHVPGWTLDFPRLRREFELKDFRAALAWTNRVGMLAEEAGHHPDVHLTRWNRVELVLYTHAIGGLHENDFVLAREIGRLWERFAEGGGSPSRR